MIRLFEEKHGKPVLQREIDRTELYVADEVFFCGSGKEVTPIDIVSKRSVSSAHAAGLRKAVAAAAR